MAYVSDVHVSPLPPERFEAVIPADAYGRVVQGMDEARRLLRGRVIWNVNSTAAGGGVAEMLHSLLAYARGMGVDTRWLVISGDPEFFKITKRIHNRLHGSPGDGGPLAAAERDHYRDISERNAEELVDLVHPHDFVILHDPQTAGLVEPILRRGAIVIWRCHIGVDVANELVTETWDFLYEFNRNADAFVFSRYAFVPDVYDRDAAVLIAPSIDAFSVKNQDMDPASVRAILAHCGLVSGGAGGGMPVFTRQDGSPGRVDRPADVWSSGPPPSLDTPVVTQVSRWDRLKDPIGVMKGFAATAHLHDAHLVLAGPKVKAVADDPEGGEVLDEVEVVWRDLPPSQRRRVHLACVPMDDLEENAAIVNALQRHATIVVQKSLQEGFGLTVTEAMWKGKPVIASAVGGIQEQIVHNESGILLDDPTDLETYGSEVTRLLKDPDLADRMGKAAKERVRENFLGTRHLIQYLGLFRRIDR